MLLFNSHSRLLARGFGVARSQFVRIVRELHHGDEAVGGSEIDAGIVCTEVLDVAEAVSREQHIEFFTLPTTHDELIVGDALIALQDKFVALGYQQESMFSIELGDAREGQRPPRSVETRFLKRGSRVFRSGVVSADDVPSVGSSDWPSARAHSRKQSRE